MSSYMVDNGYIDPMIQKGFMKQINGCNEHTTLLQEIIQHARHNAKTLHLSSYDLQDAFGSVSHDLIPHVLHHYHVPEVTANYIVDLYSKLQGRVKTKQWTTDPFLFKRGVFQGVPYSPIIFLVAFNPILQYLKQFEDKHGYELSVKNESEIIQSKKIITTPFCDDFNLITKNKIQHQKIQNDIQEKATSMGFVFKPKKCRAYSVCSGKPTSVDFFLSDYTDPANPVKTKLKTLVDEPHKFLGQILTHKNSSADHFDFMSDILKTKLENLDNSAIRN